MRLVSLRRAGRESVGIVVGAEILALCSCTEVFPVTAVLPTTVRGILEGGDDMLGILRRLVDRVAGQKNIDQLKDIGALQDAASARLAAPIANPTMILAGGMNYRAHLKE